MEYHAILKRGDAFAVIPSGRSSTTRGQFITNRLSKQWLMP